MEFKQSAIILDAFKELRLDVSQVIVYGRPLQAVEIRSYEDSFGYTEVFMDCPDGDILALKMPNKMVVHPGFKCAAYLEGVLHQHKCPSVRVRRITVVI